MVIETILEQKKLWYFLPPDVLQMTCLFPQAASIERKYLGLTVTLANGSFLAVICDSVSSGTLFRMTTTPPKKATLTFLPPQAGFPHTRVKPRELPRLHPCQFPPPFHPSLSDFL